VFRIFIVLLNGLHGYIVIMSIYIYIYTYIHVWVKIIAPYVLMSAGICISIWPYFNVFLDNMLSRSEYDQLRTGITIL